MHFIDHVAIRLKAGDGGNGIVSFRREKFVDKGGPDGGDGGKGGDIVFQASRNENTLAAFRFKKELTAPSGQTGSKRKKRGRSAEDLVVFVPVGTVVADEDGLVIADLVVDGQREIIAKGGGGGFGNAHFISSVRQAPKVAEKGEPGEVIDVKLELKLIADVGLVGLPNAGKSTLLSSISNARPEIGDYQFTTLTPNLGVVDIDEETTVLIADIPGLIEGAAEGKGLGDEFLRHVERTLVLVHVIDAYQNDIAQAYQTIQDELAAYKIDLSSRPQIVAINKTEGLDEEMQADLLEQVTALAPPDTKMLCISAQSRAGIQELLFAVKRILFEERRKQTERAIKDEEVGLPVLTLNAEDDSWQIQKDAGVFVITGARIERFAVRTDFANPHGVARLRDIMRKIGIAHELERQRVEPGDTIAFGEHGKFGSFEY